MTYEPGQVRNIFPFISSAPDWFILGGPADGNEAQVFREAFPPTKIIGLEPNHTAHDYQQAVGFPGTLLPYALTEHDGPVVFQPLGIRSGWATNHGPLTGGETPYRVIGQTLTWLDHAYGPFANAVLWLDIDGEDQELAVLRGGENLLREHRITLMNIEIIEPSCNGQFAQLEKYKSFLASFGYTMLHAWNAGALGPEPDARYRQDVIFGRV